MHITRDIMIFLKHTLKVALILSVASEVIGVNQPPLDSHTEAPPMIRTLYKKSEVIK